MRFTTPSPIRRLIPVAIIAVCVSIATATCARRSANTAPATTTPPSIILIVIDTLRADYLAAYGFDGPTSPNLDALAAESVVFERCSSQAPWTTPSMASVMTSLYPEAHGVRLAPDDPRSLHGWRQQWTRAIPDSTPTLAGCLHDRGYRTAAFVANPWLVKGLGFEQGFDTFDEDAVERDDRDATMLLHSGLQWLRSTTATGAPTFLYLHMMDVHGPYTAPDVDFLEVRDSAGFGPARTLPGSGLRHIEKYLLSPRWARNQDRLQLRVWRGRYAAGIHAADRRLGAFIRTLRDEGLWDRQLVVVTSDHGEELFDHGGWDHGFNLYEHQLHVPLMVRFPHSEHGGSRIAELVRLVDLMPTLVSLAHANEPTGMVGIDLLPLAAGRAGKHAPRLAFSASVKDRPGATAIFDGRYKLISDLAARRLRLYDIAADPGEQTDLASEEPETVGRLGARLGEEIARVGAGEPAPGRAGEIPNEQLDRLRELGYLD
jgi:arylsulfatase A-like enzyme